MDIISNLMLTLRNLVRRNCAERLSRLCSAAIVFGLASCTNSAPPYTELLNLSPLAETSLFELRDDPIPDSGCALIILEVVPAPGGGFIDVAIISSNAAAPNDAERLAERVARGAPYLFDLTVANSRVNLEYRKIARGGAMHVNSIIEAPLLVTRSQITESPILIQRCAVRFENGRDNPEDLRASWAPSAKEHFPPNTELR